jgi:hypothetical protein
MQCCKLSKPSRSFPRARPEAIDFADRLRLSLYDVRMIELAVEALSAHYNGPESDTGCIVNACRRLYGELELMTDEVLPPMSEAVGANSPSPSYSSRRRTGRRYRMGSMASGSAA